MYLADYHFHSALSFDASASLREIAAEAAVKGINELCVTDHYECVRPAMIDKNTPVSVMKREFYNSVANCNKDIKLKFGIELGQPTLNSYMAEMALTEGDFDFVLASVHGITDGDYMSRIDYTSDECYDLIDKYYDETIKIIEWGKFDVLSHFNIFLRSAARLSVDIDLTRFNDKIDFILSSLANNGKGLEINTASIYQPLGYALPGLEMLKRFKAQGGEIITVGSDSHEMTTVGRGIYEGCMLAKKAGFDKIATFSQRNVIFKEID